jgi:hypothetical protein
MFVISQFVLHKSNMCKFDNISTYAIGSGLIVYAAIYLYLLFYNNDYVSLFNKFIIYIIGIDLLLATFYYFNTSSKSEQSYDLNNYQQIPNVELLNVTNTTNNQESDSDDDSISNEEESDFEVETEDCETEQKLEMEEIIPQPVKTEELDELQTIESEQIQTVNTEQLQETLEKINSEEKQHVEHENITLSETKSVDVDSEQVIKKKRGRKPNHLKMQVS